MEWNFGESGCPYFAMGSCICVEAFVALATQQLDTIVTFYETLLGGTLRTYTPNLYAELSFPGLRLGIFQPKVENSSEFTAASSGAMSLCLEVKDLDAAVTHLTSSGYPPPESPKTTFHGREIYAYDPDGNRLILHQADR